MSYKKFRQNKSEIEEENEKKRILEILKDPVIPTHLQLAQRQLEEALNGLKRKTPKIKYSRPSEISIQIPKEIDLEKLRKDVRTELQYPLQSGVTQEQISNAILNRTQGTLSDILKSQKTWKTLKPIGRDPYIRLYIWLKMENRMELLKMPHFAAAKAMKMEPSRKIEKIRKTLPHKFTENQKILLGNEFEVERRPGNGRIEELAEYLELDFQIVKNYFENRRRHEYKE